MTINLSVAMGVGLSVGLAGSAMAQQWTVRLWAQPNATSSRVYAVGGAGGGQLAGALNRSTNVVEAGYWNATTGVWVNLMPANVTYPWMTGSDGTQQTGRAVINNSTRALLWTGTRASMVDLTPPGALAASATAVRNGMQVGYVRLNSNTSHAGFWTGTAASWTSLHPAGYRYSEVNATDGVQQGGMASLNELEIPVYWQGSAASMVSLKSAEYSRGEVNGVSGGWQGGWIRRADNVMHAAVWQGTPESFMDLHPDNARESEILGVAGDATLGVVQVGRGVFGIDNRALFWEGTLESMVDLQSLLPSDRYWDSQATSVLRDASGTYVGGFVRGLSETGTTLTYAALWTRLATPPCLADFNGDGFLDFFDYDGFVQCFEGTCPPGETADFNEDGFVDSFDYMSFVETYESGC